MTSVPSDCFPQLVHAACYAKLILKSTPAVWQCICIKTRSSQEGEYSAKKWCPVIPTSHNKISQASLLTSIDHCLHALHLTVFLQLLKHSFYNRANFSQNTSPKSKTHPLTWRSAFKICNVNVINVIEWVLQFFGHLNVQTTEATVNQVTLYLLFRKKVIDSCLFFRYAVCVIWKNKIDNSICKLINVNVMSLRKASWSCESTIELIHWL